MLYLVQIHERFCLRCSECSHLKYSQTRLINSSAVSFRPGSTTARFPCTQCGSIGFNHGLLIGSRKASIRTPPPRFTLLLCCLIQLSTFWLLCQVALSQISVNTRLPSSANSPQTHSRKSVVTWLTGRPSTNRNNRLSVSRRNSP